MSDSLQPLSAARQASLSITNPRSLLKLVSIGLVMPSNHLILCHLLLLLPSIFPSIRVFSNESVLTSGGQSIGVSASASVLPMNIQDWFLLGWTSWISLQSKGLSRVFSNTTVQKHHFTSTSLQNELVDTKCLEEWLALMIASISNRLPEASEEVIRLFHRILWARKAVLRHPGPFWIQI